MDISVDTPAETLRTLELNVVQRQIDLAPYAGTAFLTDDKDMMRFLKGQYFALEALRKFIGNKYLRLAVEQDKKEEKKTHAAYVKEQMKTLLPHDHHLFDELVKGLMTEGWKEEVGSVTYRLLNKQGADIKIFRHAESPEVIKVCFSAEPEGEEEDGKAEKPEDTL